MQTSFLCMMRTAFKICYVCVNDKSWMLLHRKMCFHTPRLYSALYLNQPQTLLTALVIYIRSNFTLSWAAESASLSTPS